MGLALAIYAGNWNSYPPPSGTNTSLLHNTVEPYPDTRDIYIEMAGATRSSIGARSLRASPQRTAQAAVRHTTSTSIAGHRRMTPIQAWAMPWRSIGYPARTAAGTTPTHRTGRRLESMIRRLFSCQMKTPAPLRTCLPGRMSADTAARGRITRIHRSSTPTHCMAMVTWKDAAAPSSNGYSITLTVFGSPSERRPPQ